MANWIFLTLFSILFRGHLAQNDPYWDQRDVTVKQGEVLKISCTVDLGADPFNVVRVYRENKQGDGEVETETIVENDGVKEIFEASGRYSATYEAGTVELTFEGIRGEDGGTLGCYSINEDENIATIEITVQVPVSNIYMVKIDDTTEVEAAEGATIHLHEGSVTGVGCVAVRDGSLEAPQVALTLNGEDETNRFSPSINAQKLDSEGGGPQKFLTEAKYTYANAQPSWEFNQKNLTCTATVEGFPSKVASIYLDVKYKPVVTCPLYENYATLGNSVTFNCVLRANPGARLTWSSGADENEAMDIDMSDLESGYSVQEKPFAEDKTDVSLTINSVNESHFTRYFLFAENDIGSTSIFVTLHKGSENTPPPPNTLPGNPPTQSESGETDPPPNTGEVKSGNNNAATATSSSFLTIFGHLCVLILLMKAVQL